MAAAIVLQHYKGWVGVLCAVFYQLEPWLRHVDASQTAYVAAATLCSFALPAPLLHLQPRCANV